MLVFCGTNLIGPPPAPIHPPPPTPPSRPFGLYLPTTHPPLPPSPLGLCLPLCPASHPTNQLRTFGSLRLETFAWDIVLDNFQLRFIALLFHLGTSIRELSLRNFRLGSCSSGLSLREHSLGNFRVGPAAWDLLLGTCCLGVSARSRGCGN